LEAVSKHSETDKYLYFLLKSATVSPFRGFRGTVGVIWNGGGITGDAFSKMVKQ
jgi:hypothetical protein